MHKIEVNELPEKYFVSANFFKAGNYKFEKQKNKEELSKLCQQCDGDCGGYPDVYETINCHIEVIDFNPKVGKREGGTMGFKESVNNGGTNMKARITKEHFDKCNYFQEQGKDYFIYKVSKEK